MTGDYFHFSAVRPLFIVLVLGLSFSCGLTPFSVHATENQHATTTAARPKIGLVLSGGGARGAAHIGVLRLLEELRIPVDYIAGTSMGAVVGALYASGMSPEQIEHEFNAIDWQDIFEDKAPRRERPFRRKRDDDRYLVDAKPGYRDGKVRLPLALVQGQKFELALNRLTLHVATIRDFDRLPVPFRAVAADIVTGEAVVIKTGHLARAVHASMAVPGAFAPVEINQRLLIDGGIAANVPVDAVREMGADIVIVVDITTPLLQRREITSALDVVNQMINLLTQRNVEAQVSTLSERDILLTPVLGDIESTAFERLEEAMRVGYEAGEIQRPRLSVYSLSEQAYAEYVREHRRYVPTLPVVQFIRIDNDSRLSDEMIAARVRIRPGQPLDVRRMDEDIGQIFALDIFETVRYEIVEEQGRTGVVIHAKEKSWGPNYFQFGIAISDNWEGDNRFNLAAAYLRPAINSRNAEAIVSLQIGEEPRLSAEMYQPLDPLSQYFADTQVFMSKQNLNVYTDGAALANYRLTQSGLELALGKEVVREGELRAGYRWSHNSATVRVGDPALPDVDEDDGSVFARVFYDDMDTLVFPKRGSLSSLLWRGARLGLASDNQYDQVEFNYQFAHTRGRDTLYTALHYDTTLEDNAPISARYRAGGFTRLSGYQQDEVSGQHFGLIQMMYYRRISNVQWFPAYLGASLEVGNVWEDTSAIGFDNIIYAGSALFGMVTPAGPLYIAYGHAEGRHNSFYFYLGKVF